MPRKHNFVIYTDSYTENSGGIIVLHKLCDLLNSCGRSAFVYPACYRYSLKEWKIHSFVYQIILSWLKFPLQKVSRYFDYCQKYWGSPDWLLHFKKAFIPILFTENLDYGAFKTNSAFNTPVTYYLGDDDTIVVYPEIVSGNPLSWHKVVRWFLYKPGALTGIINYGENELYFFFQDKFNNTDINPNPDNLLTVTNLMDKIYKQTNYNSRSGCCYILRKGKRRAKEIDLSESIIIDGKSHQEISKIFNTVERCISYDMETMYSFYAALCGCISIVVPEEGVTKEEWQPKKELRYGIAYGFSDDEINEAKRTRTLLLEYLKSEENCANESVKAFINKCEFFFSSYPPGNQIGANDTVRAKDGKDT